MDDGSKYTDKEINKIEERIKQIYGEASADIDAKMQDFAARHTAKYNIYSEKLKKGEITQDQFDAWMRGQLFQGKQWQAKKDQITYILHNANAEAINIVNGGRISVFAENANWSHYDLEHTAGVDFGFGLYDSNTVTRLIKDDPKLLPKWKIDEQKDYVWNSKKVASQITQGIIQGESLDKIAKRLSTNLSAQNENTMKTFARTAMTGAQNAGRYQGLSDAKAKNINVVKEWMATLDGHTRHSHRAIDGEKQKVGDKWHPFKFSNGCRYPGDPEGPPHEIYNCRCTLVGDLVDYPAEYNRYDNIDGKPIKNMTYSQWKTAKENMADISPIDFSTKNNLEEAKKYLQKVTKDLSDLGNKVYSGIWYNDVTLEDYQDKSDSGSIQKKIDYFNANIDKMEQGIANDLFGGDMDIYNVMASFDDPFELLNDSEAMANLKKDLKSISGYDYEANEIMDLWYTMHDSHKYKMVLKFKKALEDIDDVVVNGQKYQELKKKVDEAKKTVKDLTPAPNPSDIFGADAYTESRKKAAVWAQSPREADSVLRSRCGEVWRDATPEERDAIYEYTVSYHKFNEPLRGIEYGTNAFKGVGNTDLNAGYANNGARLNAMTDIIDKSSYDEDIWLTRGCRFSGMDKFLQCDMDLLVNGTEEQLKNELLGKIVTEYGFMSCGSSSGRGFSGDIMLRVYTPSGTKMMYVEPFSGFGNGDGSSWDGIAKQSSFGHELETILQQGTELRVTSISRPSRYDTIQIELEVVGQTNQQRWE